MPAITIQQLNEAALDADHIEAVATSTAPTATDRFGGVKVTMAGASARMNTQVTAVTNYGIVSQGQMDTKVAESELHKIATNQLMSDKANSVIGITVRGDWVTGTAYAVKDVFLYSGTWYVTVIAHTSSASFASDAANVRVYQGVTLAELGQNNGATKIGFQQGGVGAVPRTLDDKAKESISAEDYGVIGDGVYDNSPKLAALRTFANGRTINFPAGNFKFNSAVSSGEHLCIQGEGDNTILDFTGATGLHGLNVIGTTTVLPDLAIPAVKNERTVEFVSPPPLIQGDVFCIYNPTDFSWSGYKYTDRAGEWCEVLSIAGNVVTLVQPLYEGYAVADVDLYRMNSPKAWIRNIKVIGNESLLGLINTTFCKNPYFEGVSGSHKNNSVISIDRCYKPVLVRPDVANVGDGAGEDDYGIVIGNSQHGRTYGGSAFGRRHGIAHGGLDGICSVPFRDNIHDGVMLNNDKNSGVEAADFHSNGELNEYRNCTIKGGAKLQGKDNFYRSCKIHARQGGVVVHHAGVKGGTLGAIDCDFFTEENPQVSSRGIYDIGGNNIAVSEHTVLPVTFLVENCRLNGKNLTSLTTFMLFNNRGCTQKVNFKIDGLTGDVNALSAILRTNIVGGGTADSDFIIVDRISGFNTGAGVALHTALSGHYLPFPHRLQKQTGSVTLSAVSGTATTSASLINFKYTYPRAPSASVASVGGYVGAHMAFAGLTSLSGTQIRPRIDTGAPTISWTATADRDVKWTASIDEV